MTTIQEIKNKIKKKATIYESILQPATFSLGESVIGAVTYSLPNETIPLDKNGDKMSPLGTFFIEATDVVPNVIKGTKLITVFISEDALNYSDDMFEGFFAIREYTDLSEMVVRLWRSEELGFSVLKKVNIENDFPDSINNRAIDLSTKLKIQNKFDYYDDVVEEFYCNHKIGGYPSYSHEEPIFVNDYDFVLQIVSDETVNLDIVDDGNFYFYKNKKGKWMMHCDFF